MVRLALCSALSDRAADDKVVVVDSWGIEEPKTKDALAALETLKVAGKVLLVLGDDDDAVWKSFRNLGDTVHCLYTRELNAYDVLVSDYVVFTKATLPGVDTTTAAAGKAVESKVSVRQAGEESASDEPAVEQADASETGDAE
jgi:large subunit ribosomal protein L4